MNTEWKKICRQNKRHEEKAIKEKNILSLKLRLLNWRETDGLRFYPLIRPNSAFIALRASGYYSPIVHPAVSMKTTVEIESGCKNVKTGPQWKLFIKNNFLN